jgi:multisubunit Na+/H+ antiporter MnhF subunit
MLASDVLLAVIASGLLLRAAVTGDMYNLIFVLVVAAVGFLGSVTVARSVAAREEG